MNKRSVVGSRMIRRRLCVVCLGIFGLTGCYADDDEKPILRGVKTPLTSAAVLKADPNEAAPALNIRRVMPLTELDRANSRIQDKPELPSQRQARLEARAQQPLNLSLPSMEWDESDDQQATHLLPDDMFSRQPEANRVGVSGKLIWDETEKDDTEVKPLSESITSLQDDITGGEVEVKIRLP